MSASSPEDVRSFEWISDAIPRYNSFFTVDEHRERGRRLADEHDHVTYDTIGQSGGGEQLWSVTVGEGDRTALLIGASHPNEPVGSMTIDFLMHEIATNDDLRRSLDFEFICVPVADVDGVRKNEGWFDGPFTLANYAFNFYRPPPDRQVHATYPIEHEGYSFDEPISTTEVLAELIETRAPEVVFDLHNTAFGGCYYYVSEHLDPLSDALLSLPKEYDIPLSLGEPEQFDEEEVDEVVYRTPAFADQFDAIRNDDGINPEDGLLGGAAIDYANQYRDVVSLIVEVPYFYDERIEDRTRLDCSREEVIKRGIEHRRDLIDEVQTVVDTVAEYLPETAMAREATGVFSYFDDSSTEKIEWAETSAETNEPATVAQHIDERFLRQYDLLTNLGMLLRSIDEAAMSADKDDYSELMDAKRTAERLFHERIGELLNRLEVETIPIWKLVAIQARAGLMALEHRNKHHK